MRRRNKSSYGDTVNTPDEATREVLSGTSVDLLVRNGRIVTPTGILSASIAVSEGKIVGIGKESSFRSADKIIDAKERLVLPGAIDTHVHFRDPGFPAREDFESGSRAAAAGGITTVVDMPNSVPTIVEPQRLKDKVAICERKSIVDFGLYAGAGTGSLGRFGSLAEAGVLAFKTLLSNFPSPGREPEFEGLHLTADASLVDVIKEIASTGVVHVFHAETDYMIRHEVDRLKDAGRVDPLAHVESRPAYAEVDAISRIILLGTHYGDKVHIAHMSAAGGVGELRRGKLMGGQVTGETCVHYLLLTKKVMDALGTRAKIQPPLREAADQTALWDGLNDGTIDSICSDHSPFTMEDKQKDIWSALPGAPDMENMIPLMLDQVNQGRLSINTLVKISSTNPARIFGIYPKKGAIQIGSDADLTVVDMNRTAKISADKMQTKAKERTIFDGWKVTGVPVLTILRGETVMTDGDVIGKPGTGRWINGRGVRAALPEA